METKTLNREYSSYSTVENSILKNAQVDRRLARLVTTPEANDHDGPSILIHHDAEFSKDPGTDMLTECDEQLFNNQAPCDGKRLVNTNGEEVLFTDVVPYIRTSADPAENVTYAVYSEFADPQDIESLQIDLYEIPKIQKGSANGLLRDTRKISLGSNAECNRSVRIFVFGRAAVRYNPEIFSKICKFVDQLKPFVKQKQCMGGDCLTVGVNVHEEHIIINNEFHKSVEIDCATSSTCPWPICIRTVGFCYIISQITKRKRGLDGNAMLKSGLDKLVLNEIYDIANLALKNGYQAIESYLVQSSIAHQMAEQTKWAMTMGISLVLGTCGIETNDNPFEMVDVIAQCSSKSNLRVTCVKKGDGMPLMNSVAWDTMLPRGSLKSFSRSPIAFANSFGYSTIVFGNQLGRLMGPVNNLFMYDYALENRNEGFKTWIGGVKRKINTTMKYMTPLQATSALGIIMACEMVRVKCKVEEASRRCYNKQKKRMPIWKDLRTMLHYRAVDAAFVNVIPFTMLTGDEMDVLGFAGLIHDVIDFGYDILDIEPSNTFFTLTEGKIDISSAKKAFISVANGVQYVIEKYKYDACGLTVLATFFWQFMNGRHRMIPSIYNGACTYEHDYLQIKGGLLDVLDCKNQSSKTSISSKDFAKQIREAAEMLGADAVALTKLVTVTIAGKYASDVGVSNNEVMTIEREMCELVTSLVIGCEPNGYMTTFLWMIFEYMWLKTGMVLSCLVGTLKLVNN